MGACAFAVSPAIKNSINPNVLFIMFDFVAVDFSITMPNVINYFVNTKTPSKFYSVSLLFISNSRISCAAFEILVPGPKTPKTPALNKKS